MNLSNHSFSDSPPRAPKAFGTRLVGAIASLAALPFRRLVLGQLLYDVSIPRFEKHPLRTALTVLGVGLGVSVVMAVTLVNKSLVASFQTTFESIGGKSDLEVSSGTQGFDEALLETVRKAPGVARASPLLQQVVALKTSAGIERILLLGMDLLGSDETTLQKFASPELAEIRRDPIEFLNSTNNILIARSLAARYHYKLHDAIHIVTSSGVKEFVVWGFLEDEGVARGFGGLVAAMYYPAAQIAFERGATLDRIGIEVRPGAAVEDVAAGIRAQIGAGFSVDEPQQRSQQIGHMLFGLRSGLTMASLIALLVGMFLIHSTTAISIAQRKLEFGVLRALGLTRRRLILLVTLEGTLVGILGGALGLGGGLALTWAALRAVTAMVSDRYMPVAASTLGLGVEHVIGGIALGAAAATLASLIPARRAAFLPPSAVLQTARLMNAEQVRGYTWHDLLGLALAVLSPILLMMPLDRMPSLILFGAMLSLAFAGTLLMPRFIKAAHYILRPLFMSTQVTVVRLSFDNMLRDIWRTAVTASALGVAVGMATAFATFIGSAVSTTWEWLEETAPADLFVTSADRFGAGYNYVPLNAELGEQLKQVPGVAIVQPMRLDDVRYRDRGVKLMSTDIPLQARLGKTHFVEGDARVVYDKMMQEGAVVVSHNFSQRFAVHMGDKISLSVRNGTRDFEVAGVIVDYTTELGTIIVDRSTYIEAWNDPRVSAFMVHLRPGAELDKVRTEISTRYSSSHDIFVVTNKEFRAAVRTVFDQIFGLMRALEFVAILVSALGVINAMSSNVMDRTRELGVLRAVGMKRRDVRWLVIMEAVFIGAIAVVLSTFVGLIEGAILLKYINTVQTGWLFPFRPDWLSIVETMGFVTLGCAAAALYPARRAAAFPVCEALGCE
jgi:putative ABC transport system permease protein